MKLRQFYHIALQLAIPQVKNKTCLSFNRRECGLTKREMATYFGEVYHRPSRASWDDEEEFDEDDGIADNENSSKLWQSELELECSGGQIDRATVIELFIIASGALAKGFVESCFDYNKIPFAKIKEKHLPEVEGRPIKRDPSVLHRLSQSVLLCICNPKMDIKRSFEFTEKLAPWLKQSKKVIILTSDHQGNYLSGKDPGTFPVAFLKALHSKDFKENLHCDRLERPNIVAGIPAGVLTWCEINKIPAVLYICFTENFTVDSISAEPFINIFSSLPQKLLKEKLDFKQKSYGAVELSTNLYL